MIGPRVSVEAYLLIVALSDLIANHCGTVVGAATAQVQSSTRVSVADPVAAGRASAGVATGTSSSATTSSTSSTRLRDRLLRPTTGLLRLAVIAVFATELTNRYSGDC